MVKLENITKIYDTRFGQKRVLDNINFKINKGEKVGILGVNGAGKSTLIKIISEIEKPTSGKVYKNMKISWPLAFSGGFQSSLTGLDNLKFICRVYGVDYKDKIAFVKDFSELGNYFFEPIKKYSSGMKARLAFAISMVVDFDCYLIDEVVAVGDKRFNEKCKIELFEKRKDKSMIIVSHSPTYIKEHCNKASVLIEGKMKNFDDVDEAYKSYNDYIKSKAIS